MADGYEERTFWKFCDTCACTFRSVIKQLRRYEGRDNSALELTDRLNIGLILLLSSIEIFSSPSKYILYQLVAVGLFRKVSLQLLEIL